MQEPVAALFDINTDDISIVATNPESTTAAVGINTDGIITDESNTELNNENESLVGDFQRLSVSDLEINFVSGPQTNEISDIEISDIDRATHSTVTLSRWQTKLRRISSYMLVREKKIKFKEKAIFLQLNKIKAYKAKSTLLNCKVCLVSTCDTIIFPCSHFIMCKHCYDILTNPPNVCHLCPICRTIIQSHSHVFLA